LIGDSITKSAQPSATSRIRLPREGFAFLEAHNEVIIDSDFDGAFYTVHLNIEPGEWLIRTLLALPYSAEVLDPSWLSSAVRERAQKALAQYKSETL
jgi:predicted DNA-binding transcriptional regulator YafY